MGTGPAGADAGTGDPGRATPGVAGVDDHGVSEALRGIRRRLDALPEGRGNGYWLPARTDRPRRAYIAANSPLLRAAAQYAGLPAEMLAGIAWQEVEGLPRGVDDVAYAVRRVVRAVAPGPFARRVRDADKTSMGPLAVQVRRAAEVLGYDPGTLAGRQRRVVVRAVKEPRQNIFIAAAYLAQLRTECDFAAIPPERLTPDHLQELAARYNGGPYYRVPAAQRYARAFTRDLPAARAALR
ncbi:hypothetical protein [Streptomyces liangshanensis]|uniref:Uncharacterized protein n=1 Tax=Streptomyces liangshanensis TaxID=2717324 RepID=A0A6G9GY43_9ACTN|nr:hypothetical protein [Streptomyces liangshanensis]QIQ03203.1 hypothetical protein HA039_13470 [Streptomyces liangshanensis]